MQPDDATALTLIDGYPKYFVWCVMVPCSRYARKERQGDLKGNGEWVQKSNDIKSASPLPGPV